MRFYQIMDKNEIITLSSDDDTEAANRIEDSKPATIVKLDSKKSAKSQKNPGVVVKNNEDKDNNFKKGKDDTQSKIASNDSPEVVEFVDFLDKLDKESLSETDQNLELDIIDLDETSSKNEPTYKAKTETANQRRLSSDKSKINTEKVTNDLNSSIPDNSNSSNEEFSQNLKFFTEFVEYCGSLEKIPSDRVKLTRKLMKRYGEADSGYIKSQEFRLLIKKYKDKINKTNLYLIAKEITEELSYKKKIAIGMNKSNLANENCKRDLHCSNEEIMDTSVKLTEKRVRFLNKIVKKLDKLGSKIRELEEQEVYLSDEEDSTYVLLQRYRERFCQIYKRLCAYTNQIPDPNNRKICFTESKYPAINKCIETWLNKTKRFPDFSDIMKLLESQSSSLGLPSNRESVRAIAVEIFQKVGVMLQRRRIYDLWDIFCGFLDDGKDPADENPALNEILKNNFETRLKKEQEIFQHFAELQEKEKLEPEEVADEEANHSPIESENEDDKEIEEIENCLNKRVDDAIKNGEDGGNIIENEDYDGNGNNSENEADNTSPKPENTNKSKESKNNYRNCKSLKWRQESSGKSKSDISISEDSSTSAENEKEKPENGINVTEENPVSKLKSEKTENVGKDDSDLELIDVKEKVENSEIKTELTCGALCKRGSTTKTENLTPKKQKYARNVETNDFDIFERGDKNGKNSEVFGVHCCQIFPDNIFQDLNEEKKDCKKRRVFRDLTNVNRLMELHGKRKKMSGLFSPSFFHRSFWEFEKSSWKKRFKVSFRVVGSKDQRCALSQEEKSKKTGNYNSGGDSDEKEIHNYSERGGDDGEGDNYFKSHGNGSEEDNNEDDNKKRGRTGEENNENQHEEKEEEEENESENENENENENGGNIINTEPLKQFVSVQKTEKLSDCNQDQKTSLEFEKCSDKSKEKAKQLCDLETETPKKPNRKTEMKSDKFEEVNTEKKKQRLDEREGKTTKNRSKKMERNNNVVRTAIEDVKVMKITKNKGKIKEREAKAEVTKKSILPEELNNYEENPYEEDNKKLETITPEILEVQPTSLQPIQLDLHTRKKVRSRNTASPSDEERVKRFLMHSPSSISITPPKKLALSKTPSQAILQALATLRNLKDISATIIRRKPSEDDVLNEGSTKRYSNEDSIPTKRRRTNLPVISSVQSIAANSTIDFGDPVSGNEDPECDSGLIRISNVWGNSSNTYMPIPKIESVSSGETSSRSEQNGMKGRKKTPQKTVEYVVLE